VWVALQREPPPRDKIYAEASFINKTKKKRVPLRDADRGTGARLSVPGGIEDALPRGTGTLQGEICLNYQVLHLFNV